MGCFKRFVVRQLFCSPIWLLLLIASVFSTFLFVSVYITEYKRFERKRTSTTTTTTTNENHKHHSLYVNHVQMCSVWVSVYVHLCTTCAAEQKYVPVFKPVFTKTVKSSVFNSSVSFLRHFTFSSRFWLRMIWCILRVSLKISISNSQTWPKDTLDRFETVFELFCCSYLLLSLLIEKESVCIN